MVKLLIACDGSQGCNPLPWPVNGAGRL